MNKQYLVGAVIVLGLMIVALFTTQAQITGFFGKSNSTQSSIKLGAVLPFSGVNSAWGINGQRGIEMAIEELTQEGKPIIEVIYEDSKGEDAFAVSAAQKLISIDGVKLLYSSFSGPSIAVAPIANNSKALHFYEAAVKKPIELYPENSIKIGYYSYNVTCEKVALAAKNKGYKKIALVFAQKDFSVECKKAFASIFYENAELIEYPFLVSKEDFRTIMTKISAGGFDAVAITGYQADFSNFYKTYLETNLTTPILCLGGEDCVSDIISKVPNGTMFYTTEVNPEFEKKFVKKYGYTSQRDLSSAATTYDMIRFVSKANEKCPTYERDCLRNAILSSKMQTTLTTNGFNGNSLELNPKLFIVGEDEKISELK